MTGTCWMYLLFIVATSFFTYFFNYGNPTNVFWDEPYHIASAQKYLSGTFFMEQHPPLGKLLIALGEKLTHANTAEADSTFIGTDYATGFPPNFSFVGYRLFPTLLAWLTAPLLFLIFLLITRNGSLSSLLSFLYIFDNALIVHSRGAMIDSTLIFFSVAMMLFAILLLGGRRNENMGTALFVLFSAAFGMLFAFTLTTKLVGLIMIILSLPILYRLYPNRNRIGIFLLASGVSFLVTFVAVWQIHFSLATKINPALNTNGYYHASDQYKRWLAEKKTSSPSSFPIMLRDSLDYVSYYNRGVPRLDLCKPDENGSPFFFWPFGARSINYRWEQVNDTTYRYLYLQANPVVWALALFGVVVGFVLLLCPLIFPFRRKVRHRLLLATFLLMYVGYMGAISRLDRVMYLYHYFLPLVFSFVLFGIVVDNIDSVGRYRITENAKILALSILGLLIFAGYELYHPLTYYEPITDAHVSRLAIFPLWDLHCVKCQNKSLLVAPRSGAN